MRRCCSEISPLQFLVIDGKDICFRVDNEKHLSSESIGTVETISASVSDARALDIGSDINNTLSKYLKTILS